MGFNMYIGLPCVETDMDFAIAVVVTKLLCGKRVVVEMELGRAVGRGSRVARIKLGGEVIELGVDTVARIARCIDVVDVRMLRPSVSGRLVCVCGRMVSYGNAENHLLARHVDAICTYVHRMRRCVEAANSDSGGG